MTTFVMWSLFLLKKYTYLYMWTWWSLNYTHIDQWISIYIYTYVYSQPSKEKIKIVLHVLFIYNNFTTKYLICMFVGFKQNVRRSNCLDIATSNRSDHILHIMYQQNDAVFHSKYFKNFLNITLKCLSMLSQPRALLQLHTIRDGLVTHRYATYAI